ncbi:hypothetical protein J3R82DRAFT_1032 [Butyriboletus roseoflavus]|nr:hypothetical protein J3R82DRAFT_1032 [Butyriboletus roseoflavus]
MFPSFFRGTLAHPLSFTNRRLLATVASDLAGVASIRHDWTRQEIQKIYDGPLLELVFEQLRSIAKIMIQARFSSAP